MRNEQIHDGLAGLRIVVDTEQTHIEGSGAISLRTEELDLLLTPLNVCPQLA